jgi:hypothetical protein
MIAINASDGILRIVVERHIPSSLAGQWDTARIGGLTQLIHDYIEAAETVDAVAVPARERIAYTFAGAIDTRL